MMITYQDAESRTTLARAHDHVAPSGRRICDAVRANLESKGYRVVGTAYDEEGCQIVLMTRKG